MVWKKIKAELWSQWRRELTWELPNIVSYNMDKKKMEQNLKVQRMTLKVIGST